MIFTSLALLVVATILLIAGIIKSSVGLLVVSVFATLAACATLYGSFVYYRRKQEEEAKASGAGAVSVSGAQSHTVVAAPVVGAAAPTATAPLLSNRPPASAAATIGWDALDTERATQLVSTLNLDELHDLRRHEVEHAHRGEVLAAIDERIETIVALRRSTTV